MPGPHPPSPGRRPPFFPCWTLQRVRLRLPGAAGSLHLTSLFSPSPGDNAISGKSLLGTCPSNSSSVNLYHVGARSSWCLPTSKAQHYCHFSMPLISAGELKCILFHAMCSQTAKNKQVLAPEPWAHPRPALLSGCPGPRLPGAWGAAQPRPSSTPHGHSPRGDAAGL